MILYSVKRQNERRGEGMGAAYSKKKRRLDLNQSASQSPIVSPPLEEKKKKKKKEEEEEEKNNQERSCAAIPIFFSTELASI